MDLYAHASGASDSGYTATSEDYSIAYDFAGKNGYVYVICLTNGIDVNSALGPNSPYPEQKEIAVPGGISGSAVISAFAKGGIFPPTEQRNPNFRCDCK